MGGAPPRRPKGILLCVCLALITQALGCGLFGRGAEDGGAQTFDLTKPPPSDPPRAYEWPTAARRALDGGLVALAVPSSRRGWVQVGVELRLGRVADARLARGLLYALTLAPGPEGASLGGEVTLGLEWSSWQITVRRAEVESTLAALGLALRGTPEAAVVEAALDLADAATQGEALSPEAVAHSLIARTLLDAPNPSGAARGFLDAWTRGMVPSRLRILLVGDVEPQGDLDRLADAIGRIPREGEAPGALTARSGPGRVFVIPRRAAPEAVACLGGLGAGRGVDAAEEAVAEEALITLLQAYRVPGAIGAVGPLPRSAVRSSTRRALQGVGLYTLCLEAPYGELARSLRAVVEAMATLRDGPLLEAELVALRATLWGRIRGDVAGLGGVSRRFADIARYGLPLGNLTGTLPRIAALTPDALMASAKKILLPGRHVTVLVGDPASLEGALGGAPVLQALDPEGLGLEVMPSPRPLSEAPTEGDAAPAGP